MVDPQNPDVEGHFVVLDEELWDFDVIVFGDIWTFLDVKDFVRSEHVPRGGTEHEAFMERYESEGSDPSQSPPLPSWWTL